jgi:hypothetical protein
MYPMKKKTEYRVNSLKKKILIKNTEMIKNDKYNY